MHRFLVLILSLLALTLTACPPAPPAPPAEVTTSSTTAGATGAGGDAGPADPADAATADAAATSAEASASAATGDPLAGCVGPAPKHTTCDHDTDCYDSSDCSEDRCDLGAPPDPPDAFGRKGTCIWRRLPDGSPCDVSDGHDACRAGACCPDAAEPAADAGAVINVLPEAR